MANFCGFQWQNDTGDEHECMLEKDHDGLEHECECGDIYTESKEC